MAYLNSTAPALRLLACGPRSMDSKESTATAVPSMVPANIFKTRDHPLARMHAVWGVCFVGTKAELQSAGFGVGAVFPGEPGGNKKKAALPACNGFPRVEVELYGHCKYLLDDPSQTELPNYVVSAHYLAEKRNETRKFVSSQWSGIALHRSTWCDVFRGTMSALIAANLAAPWQFPGEPGCGKVRTTFRSDGKRVTVGSNTAGQEGNRTVLVVGKLFEVWIQVSEAERDTRHAVWSADWKKRDARAAQDVAALFLQQRQAPTPRPHLRLVGST